MAQYKHKVFEEETSSMGSVHLTEGVTASSTHIRFYTVWVVIWSLIILNSLFKLLIRTLNITTILLIFEQGKPKNIWSRWQNRTSLEKVLIGVCVFVSTLFAIVYLNSTNNCTEQCCLAVNPAPTMYEEHTDSFAGNGQGNVSEWYKIMCCAVVQSVVWRITFLSLRKWEYYLKIKSREKIKTQIWKIISWECF